MTKKVSRIIGILLFVAVVGIIFFAGSHPEKTGNNFLSFLMNGPDSIRDNTTAHSNWKNSFIAIFNIIVLYLLIAPFGKVKYEVIQQEKLFKIIGTAMIILAVIYMIFTIVFYNALPHPLEKLGLFFIAYVMYMMIALSLLVIPFSKIKRS